MNRSPFRLRTPARARTALLLACASLAPAARALTPAEFFAKVSPSVWLVQTFDGSGHEVAQGSAVVIAPDTLVTNCHVLSKSRSFDIIHDNLAYVGRLEMWDPARDVCQIRSATPLHAPVVPLADTSKLVVGQPVYALGNPKGLELTLSDGLLSALRRDEMRRLTQIQTTAPISHGSSGGGLFDADGRLIGITTLNVIDGQNLNFALPVDFIRELPARHLAAQQGRPMPVSPVPAPAPAPAHGPAEPPPAPFILNAPPAIPPEQLPIPAPGPAPAPAPARSLAPPAYPEPLPPPPPPPTRSAPAPAPVAPRPQPTIAAAPPPASLPPGAPRIPFLNDARQAEYRRVFNDEPYPKACAISDNGHWACTGGFRPRDRSLPADPKTRALKRCAEVAGRPCMLYQIDDQIVYLPPTLPSSPP